MSTNAVILRGHFTIYGEYLMKGDASGLVIPTQQYLASSDKLTAPTHGYYCAEDDSVALFLRAHGLPVDHHIRGDLPLGYGMGSSTVLAFLHARLTTGLMEVESVVQACDRFVHGFEPSGVDAASVTSQHPGVFSQEGWEEVQVSPILYDLVLVPRERKLGLATVETRVCALSGALSSIARELSAGVLGSGELDYDLLRNYAELLLQASVYSDAASTLVTACLERGVVAKAIGGLYDKGVLVVWPDLERTQEKDELLAGYNVLSRQFLRVRGRRTPID